MIIVAASPRPTALLHDTKVKKQEDGSKGKNKVRIKVKGITINAT